MGDGISSIYTQSYLNNYDYIITSNLSLLNQNLKKYLLTYYIIMEPNFLTEKQRKQTLLWQAIRKNYMINDDLRVWEEIEELNYPHGYEVKKR